MGRAGRRPPPALPRPSERGQPAVRGLLFGAQDEGGAEAPRVLLLDEPGAGLQVGRGVLVRSRHAEPGSRRRRRGGAAGRQEKRPFRLRAPSPVPSTRRGSAARHPGEGGVEGGPHRVGGGPAPQRLRLHRLERVEERVEARGHRRRDGRAAAPRPPPSASGRPSAPRPRASRPRACALRNGIPSRARATARPAAIISSRRRGARIASRLQAEARDDAGHDRDRGQRRCRRRRRPPPCPPAGPSGSPPAGPSSGRAAAAGRRPRAPPCRARARARRGSSSAA